MYIGLQLSTPSFSQIMELEFPRQIFQKILHSNFMKIRQVEDESFRADGETDRQMGGHTDIEFYAHLFQHCESILKNVPTR
jgi:hypothetical protein